MKQIILSKLGEIWNNPQVNNYVKLEAQPDGIKILWEEGLDDPEDFSITYRTDYGTAVAIIKEIEQLTAILQKTIYN